MDSVDIGKSEIPECSSISELHIDQRIAVLYQSYFGDLSWFAARILQFQNGKIQIEFCHFDEHHHDESIQWIAPSETQISINESSVSYRDCAVFGRGTIPANPCYANGQIIMSIDDDDEIESGIYIYDITSDSISKLCTWPDGMDFHRHGIAADPINHDIYVFSGTTKGFAVYNTVESKWTDNAHDDMVDIRYPFTLYVPSPVDELYFNGTDHDESDTMKVMKWNKKSNSLNAITSNFPKASAPKYPDLVHDGERNRMLLFGGSVKGGFDTGKKEDSYSDDIWQYGFDDKEWSKLNLKLPSKEHYLIAHSFTSVVIAFRVVKSEVTDIWCLELETMQWFKSQLKMPLEFAGGDIVETDDHFLHCLSYDEPVYHLRFDMRDMIPSLLLLFYSHSEKSMTLIDGWIGKAFKERLPDDVRRIIASFRNALF